ncbi:MULTISPECIES: RDD family protein [Paraliobacillus]|uniref:RDD family protein n=1 Tax=Paraliobacillus TaxID=200903 RepID=UPI000DD3CC88|nr:MULTISPECIES: RDD family protein [Paraliobacillus]
MKEHQTAGFWIRLGARALDGIIITTVFALVYGLIMGKIPIDLTQEWTWQIVITAYATILPVLWCGYSIGKKICRINIRRYADDGQVTFWNMFLREVVGYQLLSIVTFGVSIIISAFMVAFLKDKRAIHDFISGTYVKRD